MQESKLSPLKRKRKDMKGVTKTCKICNEDVSANNIAKHCKRNHKLNCHLCYKPFDTEGGLQLHVLTEHQTKKETSNQEVKLSARKCHLSCTICVNERRTGGKLGGKLAFRNHINEVHKDSECCKLYTQKDEVYAHILGEHANFHCAMCETVHPKYEELKMHMNVEHQKAFDCPMHHIFFGTELELEDHKQNGHTKTRRVNVSL